MPSYAIPLHMSGELPTYTLGDTELGRGASLGNSRCWVELGPDGRMKSMFAIDAGQTVAGPLLVRYATPECDGQDCGDDCPARGIPLPQVREGTYTLQPHGQEHEFTLPGNIRVRETAFVPTTEEEDGPAHCAAYLLCELENEGERRQDVAVYGFAGFRPGGFQADISMRLDEENCTHAVDYVGHDDWLGALVVQPAPDRRSVTADMATVSDIDELPSLRSQSPPDRSDLLAATENHLHLETGQRACVTFALVFWHRADELTALLKRLGDGPRILDQTRRQWMKRIDTCQVCTPDATINAGGAWAKANMIRVLARYPKGQTFTNDPGRSSNVVTRDVIWFTYGCDHFMPDASREMLDRLGETQYDSGKMPEYYNARTGERDDYGLNINDGTPLYVLGVNHHARSTGDMDWLERTYERVASACRYILSQRDDRGLVYCDSEDVGERGILSWRNVISGYQISGAVTEINAECAAALRAMGHMAENVGRDDEGRHFREASEELTESLNRNLLDPERKLYLLNIDPQGRRHTDVTADEVFPVLFRVTDEAVAYRIIRRLNAPDFWTEAGLRTTSKLDPLYDPSRYVGLIGGVWPGLTWWYAFAAARYHPEFMVRALHASFAHYARNPRVYNTVPGQFSEWFDGESLINRGMRLSPWEPPRFLWAAVEGVAGLVVLPGEPKINPLLPDEWKWTACHRVCYHGRNVSAFCGRMQGRLHVFGDFAFETDGPGEQFQRSVTDQLRLDTPGLHALAFADDDRVLVAIGSCRNESRNTPVGLGELVQANHRCRRRDWSSEQDRWTEWDEATGARLSKLAVRVEAQGFHLIELARA